MTKRSFNDSEIADLLEQSDYDSNDQDESLDLEIDNVELTDSDDDPDYLPPSDEDDPEVETSEQMKKQPKNRPMISNDSDKIIQFKTELIHGKINIHGKQLIRKKGGQNNREEEFLLEIS